MIITALDTLKTAFTDEAINSIYCDSVNILENKQVNYICVIIDLNNIKVSGDIQNINFRVYCLDRMQNDDTEPYTIWDYTTKIIQRGMERLKEMDDISYVDNNYTISYIKDEH